MHHRRPPHVVLLPLLLLHIARSVVLAELSIPVPESIPCLKPCEDKADISMVPLCAINPSTTTDSGLSNTLSCLCTDRHLLASTIPCILQSCATNSSAIEAYFTHLYTICHTHGHTEYPPPPHLLRSLGIEPPPRVRIPPRIASVPEGASFPEPAALAGAPTALPTGAHFINKLAAEAAPQERGSVDGRGEERSGSGRGVEVGHGMGFSGAGVVGVAVVGVLVVAVLVVF